MENHPEAAWLTEKIGEFTPESPDNSVDCVSRSVPSASLGAIIATLKTARDDPASLEKTLPPRKPLSSIEVIFYHDKRPGNTLADIVDARKEVDDDGKSTFDAKYESNHVSFGTPRFLEFLEAVHKKSEELGTNVKFRLHMTRHGL